MAQAEHTWVISRFLGEEPFGDDGPGVGTVEAAIGRYRSTNRRVDAIVQEAGLDDLCRAEDSDAPVNLRWILFHLLEETARHAGHADILRELVDGTTGR